MKKLSKILALVLALVMVLGLAACGEKAPAASADPAAPSQGNEKVDDTVESAAEKTEGISAPFLCFEDMALLCQCHHDTYEHGDGKSNDHKFVFISTVKGNLLHLL